MRGFLRRFQQTLTLQALGALVPSFGVHIIRILLFRVLYWGPLFSETLYNR